MIDDHTSPSRNELLQDFKNLLFRSIVESAGIKKRGNDKYNKKGSLVRELEDFVDEDGNIKDWLRARCLESVIASVGLNEYLKTLLSFRGSSPSRIAPLSLMFSSSQISRALDPIVVRLLRQLHTRRKLTLSERKLDALISVLSPELNFRVADTEVYFDVDEVEHTRNLLLEIALEEFALQSIQKAPRATQRFQRLRKIGKAPTISLKNLVSSSKNYANLNVSLQKGILQWKYSLEPTIIVKDGMCFYDQSEVESMEMGYDRARKQFYLMKKALSKTMKPITRKQNVYKEKKNDAQNNRTD